MTRIPVGCAFALKSLIVFSILLMGFPCLAQDRIEVLKYEVTWNGNKAGHGDISAISDSKHINVTAQAVSDGVLKSIIELWSRVQATFTVNTFKPKSYKFALKTSMGRPELVDLSFDHITKLVQVNKQRGSEMESHSEQFSNVYDPITAVYLLRKQDFNKPTWVDIYDGKDRARLFVDPAGLEQVKIKTGMHPAFCSNLRLVRLTGDKSEVATGKLWISNDQYRIPLLLTSSLIGTIRFELVQAQL